jgi:hypothetical protein
MVLQRMRFNVECTDLRALTGAPRRFWLAGWTLMALLNLAAGVVISSRPERQSDLSMIQRWGRAWMVNGSNVYRSDAEEVDYPPHAIVVLSPLGAFPGTAGVPFWASLNLALGVLAVYLAVRTARPEAPPGAIALPMAMFLCWGGFRTLLQFSLLTLTFGLAAMALADRRPAGSGICLGLALMKPQMAIPFVLWAIFTRRLRTLMVAAAVVVSGFLAYCLRAWVSPVDVVVRYTEILRDVYWDPTANLAGLAEVRPLVALMVSSADGVNALTATLALVLLAGICTLGYLEGRHRATPMFSAPALAGVWSLMTFHHLTYGFILLLPAATLLLYAEQPESRALRARIFWLLQAGLMCDVPGLWRWSGMPLHLPSSVGDVLLHADRVLILILFAAMTTLSLRSLRRFEAAR